MFMFSEVASKCYEKMLFSIDELWYDYQHIDVSVITIGLESIAAEDFESISKLLEVKVRVFGDIGNVCHPLVDCRS